MDVTFFPKKEITATICDYLYGAKAAFVQNTDKPSQERWICEMYAFRHNVKLTDFINPYNDPIAGLKGREDSGRIRHGLYFPSDKWKNPITGVIQDIPDYYATKYTAAGAAVFNVTVGQNKVARTPNHGQQLFDISGGAYGWDYANGVPGTNQGMELFGMLDYLNEYFESNLLRPITSFSYRNGRNEGYKMLMKYFLGGRSSALLETTLLQNSQTDFGLNNGEYLGIPQQITDRSRRINQPNSTRFKDMYEGLGFGTEAEVKQYVSDQIALTITNSGFYNDFIHRYQWTGSTITKFNDFLQIVNDAIGSNLVWRTSYDEVIQYLFFREMISNVSCYSLGNTVKIVLQKSDPYKNILDSGINEKILYNLLKVPISIEVDLTGTYLAGKSVKANIGSVRSLGSNKYIVQIPFNNEFEGFASVELSETVSPSYIDLSPPVVTSSSKASNSIIVNTNKLTKAVLFRSDAGASEYTSIVHQRSNNLSLTHEFNIEGYTDYNFKVGIVTNEGQSILNNI